MIYFLLVLFTYVHTIYLTKVNINLYIFYESCENLKEIEKQKERVPWVKCTKIMIASLQLQLVNKSFLIFCFVKVVLGT